MATVRQVPDETDEARARRGVPRATRQPRYGQPFFPVVPFGFAFFLAATVAALLFLAITNPAPLQNPADPINHEHINPRPEWYFLFLFQILKIFQGPFELIGTFIIPGLIGVVLLGLPFYDRNWSRRAVRRPVAVSLATLTVILLAVLTYIPIASTALPTTSDYLTTVSATPTWANVAAIFTKNCSGCHVGVSTYLGGLNLSTYAGAMQGGSIAAGGVVNGSVIKPGNAMGSYLWQVVAWRKDLYKVGADMPLGATQQIPKVDQQNIFNWIQNGAKGP